MGERIRRNYDAEIAACQMRLDTIASRRQAVLDAVLARGGARSGVGWDSMDRLADEAYELGREIDDLTFWAEQQARPWTQSEIDTWHLMTSDID